MDAHMNLRIISLVFLVCFGANASDLEKTAESLSKCIFSYADTQAGTSAPTADISSKAFRHCDDELNKYHDSIGPDASQWEELDDNQKQAITTIRDQAIVKVRESLTNNIGEYIAKKRNGS